MAEEKIKTVSVNVVNQLGEKISTTRLHGEVFNIEPNQQVMFDAVQVYQANCRQATAKTKKRATKEESLKSAFSRKERMSCFARHFWKTHYATR